MNLYPAAADAAAGADDVVGMRSPEAFRGTRPGPRGVGTARKYSAAGRSSADATNRRRTQQFDADVSGGGGDDGVRGRPTPTFPRERLQSAHKTTIADTLESRPLAAKLT